MNLFTKQESKVIATILVILFLVTGYNIILSLRRGRDSIRKNDISGVQNAVDTFYQKYSVYPISTDEGEIVGCFNESAQFDKVTGALVNVVVCKWGESHFDNGTLTPNDPDYKKGVRYKYVSDGKSYMFYIALEGKNEAEYTKAIANKNLQCGTRVCNYGRGSN